MIYRELYDKGCAGLKTAGIEEAALDARLLLEHVCRTNRNDLLVHGDRPVEEEQAQEYLKYIEARGKRIPLQHITGEQDFMGLSFKVNEHVLIPRQDTEILVEEVLKELHDGMSVLDMCTGSGCILISLLHYSNACQGVGADISEEALEVARENGSRLLGAERENGARLLGAERENVSRSLGMETVGVSLQAGEEFATGDERNVVSGSRVTFLHSDLFEHITGKFDVIVSNPPYIRSDVIPTLMPEVKDHEPMQALDGTETGLYFYERIISEGREHLVRGGRLYFEIGHDQGAEVSALMENAGFVEVTVVKDYAGLDRVVFGTYIEM